MDSDERLSYDVYLNGKLMASKISERFVAGGFALQRDDLFLDGCGEQQHGIDVRTDVEVYDEGDRQKVGLNTKGPRACCTVALHARVITILSV